MARRTSDGKGRHPTVLSACHFDPQLAMSGILVPKEIITAKAETVIVPLPEQPCALGSDHAEAWPLGALLR